MGHPRRAVWAAVAVAATALVVVAVVMSGDDDGRPPAAGPEARPTTTSMAIPVETVAGPGIWPFTASADAAGAPADSPYRDPDFTARAFATRYLGMRQDILVTTETSGATATARVMLGGVPAGLPPATVITMVQFTRSGPWTVIAARSPRIVLPYEYDQSHFASPLALRGQANAYEGTVQVEVREDAMVAGQFLGETFVTGSGDSDGSLGPFEGEVNFAPPTRLGGAVVFYESSAEDGSTLQATVVRAVFAGR
ncbi:MAG: Gmad2 immunoglobulin-like domain-containing protein [Acidimicrobiales bacterium]